MRRIILILFILLVLGLGMGIGYLYYKIYLEIPQTASKTTNEIICIVDIPSGASLNKIADLLENKKLINQALWFILLAKIEKAETSIQAGRYALEYGLTKTQILEQLQKGRVVTIKVTIPEGLRLNETLSLLADTLNLDLNKLQHLSKDANFIRQCGLEVANLEGYLYPDTYIFYYGITAKNTLKSMVNLFNEMLTEEDREQLAKSSYDLNETIIIASIVEKEAKLDKERAMIAAVFLNRLKLGIALQSCATVQYLFAQPKKRLLLKDLEIESDYNTYLHAGLPPGPICNPGIQSIRAVLFPADVDYLYFVANGSGDGSHTFTKTNFEHVNAKRREQK